MQSLAKCVKSSAEAHATPVRLIRTAFPIIFFFLSAQLLFSARVLAAVAAKIDTCVRVCVSCVRSLERPVNKVPPNPTHSAVGTRALPFSSSEFAKGRDTSLGNFRRTHKRERAAWRFPRARVCLFFFFFYIIDISLNTLICAR